MNQKQLSLAFRGSASTMAWEMGMGGQLKSVGNYKADISLELYPYIDTPVEAGREGRAYLLSIFQEAGLDLET
jgi:hypothetical protein